MSRRSHGGTERWVATALAGWLAAGMAASAATYPLEYRTNKETKSFSLPLERSEVRFKQEPAYAGDNVVRSLLAVAPDDREFIGFACDLEEGKLYLDLNRNLDLTDDPAGVFKSTGESWGCFFERVVIPVEGGGRRREMVVDLKLYGSRWGHYEVRSSWRGKGVAMGGREFHAAVVDDGDGVITEKDALFLDPGEITGRKLSKNDRRIEMGAPSKLVLDGEAFTLAYELSGDGKTLSLGVEPAETAGRSEVKVEGEGIERIVMRDEGTAGVFFGPVERIRVPAGTYRAAVWTRVGDEKHTSLWAAENVPQRVPEGGGGDVWRVGGPLVSRLTCTKGMGRLQFDQATVGAGGEKYSLVSSSGMDLGKPKLRVKKDGKVIHVGEFEYG